MPSPPHRQSRGVSLRLGQQDPPSPPAPEAAASARERPEIAPAGTDAPLARDFVVEAILNLGTQLLGKVQESVDAITANERKIRDFQDRTSTQIHNLIDVVDAISGEVHTLAAQVAALRRDNKKLKDEQLIAIAEAIVDEIEYRKDPSERRRSRPLRARSD